MCHARSRAYGYDDERPPARARISKQFRFESTAVLLHRRSRLLVRGLRPRRANALGRDQAARVANGLLENGLCDRVETSTELSPVPEIFECSVIRGDERSGSAVARRLTASGAIARRRASRCAMASSFPLPYSPCPCRSDAVGTAQRSEEAAGLECHISYILNALVHAVNSTSPDHIWQGANERE
jgi:hypothetical protein